MKTFAYVVIGVVLSICLMVIVSSKAEASDFLGDFCWQISNQQLMPPGNSFSGIMKSGVSHMGGGHYLLNGKVTVTGKEAIISGNAEIFSDNKIHASLRSSDNSSDWSCDVTLTAVLDSLLNGTYNSVGSCSSKTAIWSQESYSEGTMTFITCP